MEKRDLWYLGAGALFGGLFVYLGKKKYYGSEYYGVIPDDKKSKIIGLIESGKTYKETANELGLTLGQISGYMYKHKHSGTKKPKKAKVDKDKLLKEIYDDMKNIPFKREAGDYDGPQIRDNEVEMEFRHLGDWEVSNDDRYDPDNEDEDFSDWDWEEWVYGEGDEFAKRFREWAKKYSWHDKVKLGIHTGEKNWAYFSITLKKSV